MRERLVQEDLLRIDVRRLAKLGYLAPGASNKIGWTVSGEFAGGFIVVAGTGTVDLIGLGPLVGTNATVALVETPLTYGQRTWWLCPTCTRRCAVLFPSGSTFRCRGCVGLPHLSAALGRRNRITHRREVAAARCGADITTGRVTRPRYMRVERWVLLLERYRAAERAVLDTLRAVPTSDNLRWQSEGPTCARVTAV